MLYCISRACNGGRVSACGANRTSLDLLVFLRVVSRVMGLTFSGLRARLATCMTNVRFRAFLYHIAIVAKI